MMRWKYQQINTFLCSKRAAFPHFLEPAPSLQRITLYCVPHPPESTTAPMNHPPKPLISWQRLCQHLLLNRLLQKLCRFQVMMLCQKGE